MVRRSSRASLSGPVAWATQSCGDTSRSNEQAAKVLSFRSGQRICRDPKAALPTEVPPGVRPEQKNGEQPHTAAFLHSTSRRESRPLQVTPLSIRGPQASSAWQQIRVRRRRNVSKHDEHKASSKMPHCPSLWTWQQHIRNFFESDSNCSPQHRGSLLEAC